MKKSRELIGLTVVSIQEGKELGIVKQLVIDAATGSIAALLINDGKWYLGAKAIPFSAINGIGEYAVTIHSEAEIISITPTSIFGKLMNQNINVIGSSVLTRTGNFGGIVSELSIGTDGKINECLIDDSNEIYSVLAEHVITFGKDVLIISDGNEALPVQRAPLAATVTPLMPDISEAFTLESLSEPLAEPLSIPEDGIIKVADFSKSEPEQQDEQPIAERETDELAKMFEEKQRKYLLGKTSSRRIEDENGVVIVDHGEEITEAVLQKATLSGKFVELSMSIY